MTRIPPEQVEPHWTAKAVAYLKGRTITAVRYMLPEESADLGFFGRGLVLSLDNGTLLWAQSDDEGNNAGALALQTAGNQTIVGLPILRL